MTTILTNPGTLGLSGLRGFSLQRAARFFSGALIFIAIGAVISVLIAWMLGFWAEPESAMPIT